MKKKLLVMGAVLLFGMRAMAQYTYELPIYWDEDGKEYVQKEFQPEELLTSNLVGGRLRVNDTVIVHIAGKADQNITPFRFVIVDMRPIVKGYWQQLAGWNAGEVGNITKGVDFDKTVRIVITADEAEEQDPSTYPPILLGTIIPLEDPILYCQGTNAAHPSSAIFLYIDLDITVARYVPSPVTGITGVPTTATAGVALTLKGTVKPAGAPQTIVWSVEDPGTTGATINGSMLNTTAAGTVTVKATIANGLGVGIDYTEDFIITVHQTVGIAETAVSNLNIYPNPTNGKVYINIESEIKVYNQQGNLLLETFGKQVDLSGYPQGVYLLQVEDTWAKIIKN